MPSNYCALWLNHTLNSLLILGSLFFNNLACKCADQWGQDPSREVQLQSFLLFEQVLFCHLLILDGVQWNPAQSLLFEILQGWFNEWCLKLTYKHSLVVSIADPFNFSSLYLKVSLDVSHLHVGKDYSLEGVMVNSLIVSVFGDLVQDGSCNAVLNNWEAVISENV